MANVPKKYLVPEVNLVTHNNKKWYLEYSIIVAGDQKRSRISKGLNRIKDLTARKKAFGELRKQLLIQLSAGRIPEGKGRQSFTDLSTVPVGELIDKVVADKKLSQKKASHKTTRSHLNNFKTFLITHGLSHLPAADITKNNITDFRRWLLRSKNANRSVNNYMIDVNGFFNYLINEYDKVIDKNPCKGISKLQTQSETHIRYTEADAKRLSDAIKKADAQLHLFCQFIVYCFMRIDEIRFIKVGDINLQTGRVLMRAAHKKTSDREQRIIDDIFLKQLKRMNLHKRDKDKYLFKTLDGDGSKPVGVNYFRLKFKKIKTALGFHKSYTMYGLKHTYVSTLLENGAPWTSVMNRTGHTTMSAFEKYATSIIGSRYYYLSDKYGKKF